MIQYFDPSKNTLFLDMDGVVANFDKFVLEKMGWTFNHQTGPGADTELWELANTQAKNVEFLTAIPRRSSIASAETDKREWIAKYFGVDAKVRIGLYSSDNWTWKVHSMSEKFNRIDLIIGDSSGDGHDKRETVTILSNRNVARINAAYVSGLNAGFPDLCDGAVAEYEENLLTPEFTLQFVIALYKTDDTFSVHDKHAIVSILVDGTDFDTNPDVLDTLNGIVGYEIAESTCTWLSPRNFAILYMAICKAGDPDLVLALDDEHETICIGGYGLFE